MVSRSIHASSRAMHFEGEYDPNHGTLESSLLRCLVRGMMRGEVQVGHAKYGVVRFTANSPVHYRAMAQKIREILASPPADSRALRLRLRERLQRDLDQLDVLVRDRRIPLSPPHPKARRGRKPRTHRDA